MTDEIIERLLESLEDTCFPIQLDWSNKDLYIRGMEQALRNSGLQLVEAGVSLE